MEKRNTSVTQEVRAPSSKVRSQGVSPLGSTAKIFRILNFQSGNIDLTYAIFLLFSDSEKNIPKSFQKEPNWQFVYIFHGNNQVMFIIVCKH